MAPMILVHLAVIFYAMRMRLTAADILSRTQDSIGWGLFYGAFVILASIHAAIGCRTVLSEWGGIRGAAGNVTAAMIGLILFVLGLRAVAVVVLP